MYIPASFEQTDRAVLVDFIRRHSFGLLVSQSQGSLFATHLPLLVEDKAGENGHLLGHVARANPQWKDLAGQQVLAVFSGPHAYVSPTWYETEQMVPTWNYLAVHVYGRCELVTDETEAVRMLAQTVAIYERPLPMPWQLDTDDAYVRKLIGAIVAFRVVIERIEGKWKLGQNHPAERRENAARHLADSAAADARTIAELMLDTLR